MPPKASSTAQKANITRGAATAAIPAAGATAPLSQLQPHAKHAGP